ncbi:DUF1565 domain-containing protein [Parabacteroides sp.]|uniref:DUF1565 domain-containing protein n=1 Tax=Parabacteroides sp. TaxID=1869337 RepID=UPI00257BE1F7|nr:DUF1565 domain-containing protein [Parabacteroides sp.]
MKRRLLFLFAVFMVATSVGWGQTDLYVSTSGSDDNGGGVEAPLATIARAIEKAADGATIRVAEGTFPVSSTISKALTIVGEGNDKSVLKGYLIISVGTQKNVSFQNVQLTNDAKVYSSPTKPVPLILMKDQSAVLSLRGCALINNAKGWGNGYGEGVYKKMGISIQSDSTALGGEIHLINSSIMMAADYQSGISCNGAVSQLTIDHSSITVNEYPRSGIFGIDVHCDGMNVDISKSTIELGKFYYPIYILGPNQTINIKDESLIKGWCAIYANAVCDNSVVNVSSSKLVGYSEMTGASNGFSTLPIQATMNVRYVITDSEIQTSVKDQTISPMTPISFAENTYIEDSHANNCYVELRGNTIVSLMRQDNNPAFISDDSNYLNRVLADQSVKFRTVDASGNEICEAIVIRSAQGDTVRMALDTTAFKSCLTSAFENDNIILPIGTYTLPQTLTLDRSQGLIGAGKDKTIIEGAILVNGSANNTATDVKIKGLSIDYTPTKVTSGKCTPIIEVTGNADLLIDNCIMNNNTQGYGDRKNPNPAEALQNAILLGATAKGTVRVENTTINLAANAQSGVLIDGELTDVSLVNTKIEGQVNGSNQFGVYIHHKKTPVTVDSTTILLNNHYCIYANNAGDQKLTIKNKSNIVGYGALYLYETSDMNVHVSGGSTLTGKTKNKGVSDSFAAIAISTNNSTVGASNNEIVIEDSYIGNKFDEQETMPMTPIKINGNYTPAPSDNKIILKGKTIVSTTDNIKNPTIVGYGMNPDEYNNVVMVEGTDVQFQDQKGKPCVIINKPDGSFRNAAVSIVTAIDFGELYGSTYYHEGIAYAGDIILIPDTTMAETLNSLNAAKPNFFPDVDTWEPYTIPDGVIFNCKDGRLVIEENTAKAYAIANPFKRVYWLNQGAQSFSIKECVVAIDIKSDTTWATSFQDRQVNILNGATLTVSVPMALDTVMMEEDAQVVFTAKEGKLTARSLRFAPFLSATGWKAFGMPFTSAVINNSTEEEILAPSQQSADNGIWFARLKDNKTPEFVVDESAFGMAGLWAANGDTYTISSEGAFEFKTLEEPAAPTETGTFLMCSNPNTFTITLKQSAYILTADGTSFEQEANPEIKPFQSFVLTDAKTLSTLRSLRIGDGVVTGNQTIEPVDGYYVTTDRGAIVIHTPEPMDVVIIGMNGKVAYRGEVTDGQRIMVSSGIYAVNGQLVRVK